MNSNILPLTFILAACGGSSSSSDEAPGPASCKSGRVWDEVTSSCVDPALDMMVADSSVDSVVGSGYVAKYSGKLYGVYGTHDTNNPLPNTFVTFNNCSNS